MTRSFVKMLAVAALLVGLPAIGAYALSVDQTRTFSARYFGYQMTHYYRLTINYNDANISTAQAFGALKQNAFIKSIDCHTTVAFNAGTTNVVTIGTTTGATELIAASGGSTTSITTSPAGVQHLTTAAGIGLLATSDADHTLYAKYAQTGTAATQGSVTCLIAYAPNNDL